MATEKLTDEQKADLAAQEAAKKKAAFDEERRVAKEKMLARNAKRIADLIAKGELLEGETLEQYDTRKAEEKAEKERAGDR